MTTAIAITLMVIAALSALGGIAHQDQKRGRNAAIVAVAAIIALAAAAIGGY